MSANPYSQLDRQVNLAIRVAIVVGILILAFGVFFIQAWILMLIVGALYNSMGWFQPISYGVSCLIVLGFNLLGGIWRGATQRS